MERKEQTAMYDIVNLETAAKQLTKREKVGQSFMPAAYINDSEEQFHARAAVT